MTSEEKTYEFVELCKGCGEKAALTYCMDCQNAYCETCSVTIHQLALFSKHTQVPIALKPMSPPKCTGKHANKVASC